MAKRKSASTHESSVNVEKASRLYKLVQLLGQKPRTRDFLTKKLGIGVRGFYRDLDALRSSQIEVSADKGKYALKKDVDIATDLLPVPDPILTLGEANQLAKGRSKAHLKLRKHLQSITGPAKKSKPRRKK